MEDLSRQTDRALQEGRSLVRDNRAGGRHRRVGHRPIGRGSAGLRARHLATKLVQMAIGILAVLTVAGIAGAIIGGIGFWGVMLTAMAIVAVTGVIATRRIRVPDRADLNRGDVRQMVARTELWLEHRRAALPPPAVQVLDRIGLQLDALGAQLQGVDQTHPAVAEVRRLVGEHLPGMVDSYCRIPAHLRREQRAGSTPDQQIAESLDRISREIDSVTRQLAEGSLDDLAVKSRFLEYRYGEGAVRNEAG